MVGSTGKSLLSCGQDGAWIPMALKVLMRRIPAVDRKKFFIGETRLIVRGFFI